MHQKKKEKRRNRRNIFLSKNQRNLYWVAQNFFSLSPQNMPHNAADKYCNERLLPTTSPRKSEKHVYSVGRRSVKEKSCTSRQSPAYFYRGFQATTTQLPWGFLQSPRVMSIIAAWRNKARWQIEFLLSQRTRERESFLFA